MNYPIKSIHFANQFFRRFYSCITNALKPSYKSAVWLLKLMIPVSLAVTLLEYWGIIGWISNFVNPVFELIGISGQGAFVFITSMLLNIYSAIAVITSFTLTMREITILALMCLISHNLIIETIVQRKTGSSGIRMVAIRIITSIAGAIILNLILPYDNQKIIFQTIPIQNNLTILTVLLNWITNIFFLSIKVILFIFSLMTLQKVLEEFGVLKWLSKIFSPFLKIFGLPLQTSFLWIVANVVGLMYGSAIMFDELSKGKISHADSDLLNHHVAVSHSLLEDTLLFVAIGVPLFWITFPRLILAIVVVWLFRKLGLIYANR